VGGGKGGVQQTVGDPTGDSSGRGKSQTEKSFEELLRRFTNSTHNQIKVGTRLGVSKVSPGREETKNRCFSSTSIRLKKEDGEILERTVLLNREKGGKRGCCEC